jgi:hypothetical protein
LKELHRETIEKIQRVSRARACGDGRLRELVKRMNDDFEKIRPSWGHVNHVVGALFIAEAMIVKERS